MAESAHNQQNAPQISLTEALAAIDRGVEPVEPRERDLDSALGCTLAAAAGADTTLRLAGARLRRIDIALLAEAGVKRIDTRVPRLLIVRAATHEIDATCALIAGAIEAEGGAAKIENADSAKNFEAALARDGTDAVIAIGDAGEARDDVWVRLAKIGRIAFDGVALSPGGAIAFGNVNRRPVLLLPGRFDTALCGWLAVGRRLLARLSFRLIEKQPYLLELARPVASTRGIAEIVAVRRRAAQIEPLPTDWTAETIARADGWILVPAESDGLPAGTRVQMRTWP